MAGAIDLHHIVYADGDVVLLLQCDLLGAVAHQFGNAFLKTTHSAFVGVLINDRFQKAGRQFQLLRFYTVLRVLLGQQVAHRDLQLLLLRVSVHFNDLHTIAQCGMDGAQ